MTSKCVITTVACVALVTFTSTGCATKKYVNKTVAPIDQRLGEQEKKTTEQAAQLEAVENDASKSRERIGDLDSALKQTNERVGQAANAANQAGTAAQQAQQQAADARGFAEKRTGELGRYMENYSSFKLSREAAVLFEINRSVLGDEGKRMLDEVAKSVAASKRYVIEIQGFTDSRGPAEHNLALSQRRADAVVRYLTMEHKIPLRNIHRLGAGAESPVADNKTRQGRMQNRRVEVRLYSPELESSSALTSAMKSN